MDQPPLLPRGLDLATILANEEQAKAFVDAGIKRLNASRDYMNPFHDRWARYYKLYRSVVDRVDDSDEPNTAVSYAFGLVEDLVSKNVEPLMKLRPPCSVKAKRANHERAAENFAGIASTHFGNPHYQEQYTISERERHITGNAWERDCYYQEYESGRRWAKVQRNQVVQGIRTLLGKMLPPQTGTYESMEEVPVEIPMRVGYGTEFPSVFRTWPEPSVSDVRRMHWLIEEVPSVALEDLERVNFKDPATGQRKNFFDFSALKQAANTSSGELQPIAPSQPKTSVEDEIKQAVGELTRRNQSFKDDISRIHLLWIWEQRRVWCIAQGQFLVAYQEDVFQIPRIPYRLRRYTPQKNELFAVGAIEPIENDLYELRDIHVLSMRNWVRLVNRMIAYDDEAVPFPDDFQPRAGGRIRVRPGPGRSINSVIGSVDVPDVTQTMLMQESNSKGGIEKTMAAADFAPGAGGTQQSHKTAHGLEMISQNLAFRQDTTRRMSLLNFQDQMWFMNKLYDQFLFDKTPFTIYGPDGTTVIKELDRWDIETQGVGFDFLFDADPSFGDSAIQRNQLMVLMDVAIKYMQARKMLGATDWKEINLEEIARKLFRPFGWSDTSEVLRDPAGPDPEQELQLMMTGNPVAPTPKENLSDHLMKHVVQLLKITPLIQQGKIDPQVGLMLKAHIMATQQMLAKMIADPQRSAIEVLQPAGLLAPGMQQGGEAPLGPIDGQGGAMSPTTPPLPATTGLQPNQQAMAMQ